MTIGFTTGIYVEYISTVNFYALSAGAATIAGIALVTLVAALFNFPVETIGTKFGALPKGFSSPNRSGRWHDGYLALRFRRTQRPGFGQHRFGFIRRHSRHRRDRPHGYQYQVRRRFSCAGIIHALVLLIFALLLGPLVQAIPLAALAGVLMVVVDLTAAVQVGVLLAVLLFVKRARDTASVAPLALGMGQGEELGAATVSDNQDRESLASRKIPLGCEIYEIDGPFFFGVADMFQDALGEVEKTPKVFILRLRHVPNEVREQPEKAMRRYGLFEEIGAGNVFPDIDLALAKAESIVKAPKAHR